MFYNRSGIGVNIEKYAEILDDYILWNYEKRTILSELGKPDSLITYVADRKGHDQRYAIDPSKAMKELEWAPTTMFADGIKLTIQWYKEHMDWMAECTSGEYM